MASMVSGAISPAKGPAKMPPEMGSSLSSVGPPSALAAAWNSQSTFAYAVASTSCASSRECWLPSLRLDEAAAVWRAAGEARPARPAARRGGGRGGAPAAEVRTDGVDTVEGPSVLLRVCVVLCEAHRCRHLAHRLRECVVVADAEKVVDGARRAARAARAGALDETQNSRVAKRDAGVGMGCTIYHALAADELLPEDRVRHHLDALEEEDRDGSRMVDQRVHVGPDYVTATRLLRMVSHVKLSERQDDITTCLARDPSAAR